MSKKIMLIRNLINVLMPTLRNLSLSQEITAIRMGLDNSFYSIASIGNKFTSFTLINEAERQNEMRLNLNNPFLPGRDVVQYENVITEELLLSRDFQFVLAICERFVAEIESLEHIESQFEYIIERSEELNLKLPYKRELLIEKIK